MKRDFPKKTLLSNYSADLKSFIFSVEQDQKSTAAKIAYYQTDNSSTSQYKVFELQAEYNQQEKMITEAYRLIRKEEWKVMALVFLALILILIGI